MVASCSAPGCSSIKDNADSKSSIMFHRFPFKKPELLAKWVKAMKNPNFKPNVKSLLCSYHFVESDYEIRANSTKHLKADAVPSNFEKRKPGRKKKVLSENEVSENSKENVEDSPVKRESEEVLEEEYLESQQSDKEETNLAEIIGDQEKGTVQILIVGEDGKITNSEYVLQKDLVSDENEDASMSVTEVMEVESDEETRENPDSLSKSLREVSVVNYRDLKNSEKIKILEANWLASRKKVRALELKCRKMNRKLNKLKLLLKLLVLKKGRGEKNLRELLGECEKDMEDTIVRIKQEAHSVEH